ncbi:hypothetical protein QYE76_040800 [Lolium multiflorum]|uniref:Uncharacterized protein n=1 Tax=Lolium multiflorum TaxID=4521 RepID=A0AAD8WT31_LOLMU|nr:hypothetical protein QYE76_040800 [Lolium multiflorum]
MKAEVLEEVKKEIKKMLDAGFIRPCGLNGFLMLRSYLGAIAALIVVIVAVVGAAPGRLVIAAVAAAGRTLVVLILLVSIVVFAVEVAEVPGPGAMAFGRRLVGGAVVLLLLLLHLLGGGDPVPGKAVVVAFLHRFLIGEKRRSLSPSFEDLSSSDQMEKSWSSLSHAVGARISYAACVPQMVRAYQMYRDDNKNAEFKFPHVFTHIETCNKWADMRAALAKGGLYNPMASVPIAVEGRPELG